MEKSFGYLPSKFNGTEIYADNVCKPVSIPNKYVITDLGPIRDQKSTPKCVSICLTDIILWKSKFFNRSIDIKDDVIFNAVGTDDGIEPVKACKYISTPEFQNKTGMKFDITALVKTAQGVKQCIVQFGPVMACIPVKSNSQYFWYGSDNLGGQAVLLTGYDDKGFIIRNSWGTEWNDDGYSRIPYDEFIYIKEAWTVIR